ncbi:MAG: hypothetical protein JXQ86_04165 [Methylophilaceae bacterium]
MIRKVYSDEDLRAINLLFDNQFKKFSLKIPNKNKSFKFLSNASHIIPDFEILLTNSNLHIILKKLSNRKQYAYTSHSDMHVNNDSEWHKDVGDGDYFPSCIDSLYENKKINIFRIGVYLNKSIKSGSLSVRDKSHLKKNLDVGKSIYLPSSPGDIIIFDPRITHKGVLGTRLIDKFLRYLSIPYFSKHRKACFFTFGVNDKYTRDYANQNMKRQLLQTDKIVREKMPTSLKTKLNKINVASFF